MIYIFFCSHLHLIYIQLQTAEGHIGQTEGKNGKLPQNNNDAAQAVVVWMDNEVELLKKNVAGESKYIYMGTS